MIIELLNPDNINMSVFQGLSLIMLFHRKKDFSVAFHSSNMTNYSNLGDRGELDSWNGPFARKISIVHNPLQKTIPIVPSVTPLQSP
jgi:hypothetical protein